MKRFFIISTILVLFVSAFFFINNFNQIERAGCCSHHGGVCGCSGSRVACCDGTLSPSCRCY